MHARIMVILVTLKGNFLYFQVFSKIGIIDDDNVIEFQRSDLVQSTLVEPMQRPKKY